MVKNKKIPDGWTKKELRDIAPLQRDLICQIKS